MSPKAETGEEDLAGLAEPPTGALAVEPGAARVLGTVAGGEPRAWAGGSLAGGASLRARWAGGWGRAELVLPSTGPDALRKVRTRLGDGAVRDLLGFQVWARAAGVRSTEPVWTWTGEHLALLGLADGREARAALRQRLAALAGTVATFEHEDRTRSPTGPLVVVGALSADRSAVELRVHPGLTRGLLGDGAGGGGRGFWPVELAALRSRAPGALPLLALLGERWRQDAPQARRERRPPRAVVKVGALVERLGLRGRGRALGARDDRLGAALGRALAELVHAGSVSGWRIEGGDQARGTGRLVAEAAPVELRGRRLPNRGRDLDALLAELGWSQRRAAAALGVGVASLSRALRHGEEPLPQGVRRAVVALLWGSSWAGEP